MNHIHDIPAVLWLGSVSRLLILHWAVSQLGLMWLWFCCGCSLTEEVWPQDCAGCHCLDTFISDGGVRVGGAASIELYARAQQRCLQSQTTVCGLWNPRGLSERTSPLLPPSALAVWNPGLRRDNNFLLYYWYHREQWSLSAAGLDSPLEYSARNWIQTLCSFSLCWKQSHGSGEIGW